MSATVVDRSQVAEPACDPATRVTKSLLGYGAVAGPFYVVAVLAQALLRPGFNLLHNDVSLLSNGSFGWVQITTFILTGAMVIAFAVGLSRALRSGRAATWAPRLLAVYGLGLVGAGIFVADPMYGFPPGTPAGRPTVITAHGMLHIVAAGIGFFCLVAACIVIARRFAAEQRPAWAWFSAITGIVFLAAFFGLASGSNSAAVVLGFWVALLLAWGWMGALAVRTYRAVAEGVAA